MKTKIYSFTLMIAALLWLQPQQALAEESPFTVGPPAEVAASEYVAVEEGG